MLSANFTGLQKPERKEYDALPEDTYQVEIADITDREEKNYEGNEETFLDFTFVVLDEGQYRGRRLWKKVRPVISPEGKYQASFLYLIIERAIDQLTAQKAAIDPTTISLHSLIGKQLRVVVNQKTGANDKRYNNIVHFQVKKGDLEPFEKSEAPKPSDSVQHSEQPATIPTSSDENSADRTNTINGIFALSKKLWPIIQAAPDPKEALKKYLKSELNIEIVSFSEASLDDLRAAWFAMKDLESKNLIGNLKAKPDTPPEEPDIVNVEDIPF